MRWILRCAAIGLLLLAWFSIRVSAQEALLQDPSLGGFVERYSAKDRFPIKRITGVSLAKRLDIDASRDDEVLDAARRVLASVGVGAAGIELTEGSLRRAGTCLLVRFHQQIEGQQVLGSEARVIFQNSGEPSAVVLSLWQHLKVVPENSKLQVSQGLKDAGFTWKKTLQFGWQPSQGFARPVAVVHGVEAKTGRVAALQVDLASGAITELDTVFSCQSIPQHQRLGQARIPTPNPVADPVPTWRPLGALLGDGHLRSEVFWTQWDDSQTYLPHSAFSGTELGLLAKSLRGVWPVGWVLGTAYLDFNLASAHVHSHLEQTHSVLGGLGFALDPVDPFLVVANSSLPSIAAAAAYYIDKRSIHFTAIGNISFYSGFDLDIASHEYCHAFHHTIGGDGAFGFPYGVDISANFWAPAIGEGLAQLAASALTGDEVQDEWYYSHFSAVPWSTKNSVVRAQYTQTQSDLHESGMTITGAYWDLATRIGLHDAMKLSVQSVFYMSSSDNFESYLRGAVFQADRDLFGGRYQSLIRRSFAVHDIHAGDQPTEWPHSPLVSQRPYADDGEGWRSATVPGATEVKAMFDEFTKAHLDIHGQPVDSIEVADGAGNPVSGSPFQGTELAGQVLTVPGDTLQVRILSTPGDQAIGAGYALRSLVASDSTNQPPVAALSAISPSSGFAPLAVQFDLSGCQDPEGGPLVREFDPGDGTPTILVAPGLDTITHCYYLLDGKPIHEAVDLQASMTVRDNQGNEAVAQMVVSYRPAGDVGPLPVDDQALSPGPLVGGDWRPLVVRNGTHLMGHLGHDLAYSPDTNGDGVGELHAIHRGDPLPSFPNGRAGYLISFDLSDLFQIPRRRIAHAKDVALAHPDVNGDGVPDVLYSGRLGRFNLNSTGHIGVMDGAASNNVELWRATGDYYGDFLGRSLCLVGDANGDGVVDIAAGGPQPQFVLGEVGNVEVLSATSGSTIFRKDGVAERELFGWSLASVGDLNGDGCADFLVSAPYAEAGGKLRGRVEVLSATDGTTLRTHAGGLDFGLYGHAVHTLPDIDGDGVGDYAIMAQNTEIPRRGKGELFAYSAASGALLWRVPGAYAVGSFGQSLDEVDDYDLDGVADLLIGAPGEGASGVAYLCSGASGRRLLRLETDDSAGSTFGHAVAALEDLDGNGWTEFVVSNPTADTSFAEEGGIIHAFRYDPFIQRDLGSVSAAVGGHADHRTGFS